MRAFQDDNKAAMLKIAFAGYQEGEPVIPLAFACGVGRVHAYGHRFNAIEVLCREAPAQWQSVSPTAADVIVYPHRYLDSPETRAVSSTARGLNLPCVFFEHSDDENHTYPIYGRVYRTALRASHCQLSEKPMSPISDDLLYPSGDLLVREKGLRPLIGFCGNVGTAYGDARKLMRGRLSAFRGGRLRRLAIRALRRSPAVDTKIVERQQYWGGVVAATKGEIQVQDEAVLGRLRTEFVENTVGTDYGLCVRGAGNYSIRFYEVLSAGRVPVFVDTDCSLPFDDRIDWRKHCVWVPAEDVSRIGEIVADFHQSTSSSEFATLQFENRKLWMDWLEATSFYRRVFSEICPD